MKKDEMDENEDAIGAHNNDEDCAVEREDDDSSDTLLVLHEHEAKVFMPDNAVCATSSRISRRSRETRIRPVYPSACLHLGRCHDHRIWSFGISP
jgi:hypothetical protein